MFYETQTLFSFANKLKTLKHFQKRTLSKFLNTFGKQEHFPKNPEPMFICEKNRKHDFFLICEQIWKTGTIFQNSQAFFNLQKIFKYKKVF